jgi:hypothetical protein
LLLALLGCVMFFRDCLHSAEIVFLAIGSILTVGLMLTFNCDIGASRDWDVMSIFGLPVILLSIVLFKKFHPVGERFLRALLVVILITLWHTVPWVLINANETRFLARFDVLQDSRLWSRNALRLSSHTASKYYMSRGEKQKALD